MVRSMRKYNKWFMAIGGAVLMVAWLVGPSSSKLAEMHRNRVVAKIDGHAITAADQYQASKEMDALSKIAPGLLHMLGVEPRDTAHWLLLTREAQAAGFVGEGQDGRNFGDWVASQLAEQEFQRERFSIIMEAQTKKTPQEQQAYLQQARENIENACKMVIQRSFGNSGMNAEDGERMLARASGVFRMVNSYVSAPRVSDRLATLEARHDKDAAIVDYVFVPASLTADKAPDPDQAALQSFFDKYKAVKPGEGEYGIGYFFPPRVKLEWLTLDRKAFEGAVKLDAVDVLKRYKQGHPSKYPGEFEAERPKIEKEMTAEAADTAMDDAALVIHAELLKATKGLDADGKFKKLPADWDQRRPRLDALAQAVAAAAKQNGLDLPLPPVTEKGAQWTTLSELSSLPGIGRSAVQQGGMSIPFENVIGWTKELPGAQPEQAFVLVQTGLTLAENPLVDRLGNRYFVTVLATRGDSAPDSMDDIHDRVLADYKSVQAFEALKSRQEELRSIAQAGGLEAVAAAVDPQPPAEPGKEAPKAKVEVRKQVAINRDRSGGDANLDDPELRNTLMTAAAQIDPHTDWGKADPAKAFVAIPTSKHLGVAVFHVLAYSPLSVEAYRAADHETVGRVQSDELKFADVKTDSPFTLSNMLKRHVYVSNDKTIRTPEDLKKEHGEG